MADRAGVARSLISDIERGRLERTSLARLRAVAAVLEIRLDVVARWRGGELDRLINARHSALHENVAFYFSRLPGWHFSPEISFSVYGERGVIDILAFHPASGSLLVIELKTAIVDVNDLVGSVDRKSRLAIGIAADRGWAATTVSRWVIVTRDRTNQRRIEAHRSMLRAAFPQDGHAVRSWLAHPVAAVSALSMWSSAVRADTRHASSQRIRLAADPPAHR